MVGAGKLRRRVAFQARSSGKDTYGAATQLWATVATCWAAIEPLSARERAVAAQTLGEVSHQITVRYQPFMADPVAVAAMRIQYGARLFNVGGAINHDERNQVVTILATEGVNNG